MGNLWGLGVLVVVALLFLWLAFSRGSRNSRRSREAADLYRAGSTDYRQDPPESPASYWNQN